MTKQEFIDAVNSGHRDFRRIGFDTYAFTADWFRLVVKEGQAKTA